MRHSNPIFEVGHDRDTLIVAPARKAAQQDRAQFAEEIAAMLRVLEEEPARHVVVDFRGKSYFGCTEFAFFFLQLWNAADKQGGRMALCGLSDHEREMLRVSKLDGLWPICRTRKTALALVRQPKPSPVQRETPQLPELFA